MPATRWIVLPAETLAQGLDDGNPAADRRFIVERGLVQFGQVRELMAVRREHRLVGGDDGQAACERGLDRLESDAIRSADQLDEGVDFRRSGHRRGVLKELGLAETRPGVRLRRAL